MSRPTAHQIDIATGLSEEAHRRLDQAERLIDGLEALAEVNQLLSQDQPSRWARADDIAARLHRFEATAWPRIKQGHRRPRGTLESLLSRLASCDALLRSERKIYDLLG